MIKLTTRSFWDQFYEVSRDEWYFPLESMTLLIKEVIKDYSFPFILHGGCGNAFLKETLKDMKVELFEYDFSINIIKSNSDNNNNDNNNQDNQDNYSNYNLFIADTLKIPIRNNIIDIIIEKGLFDSLTSINDVSNINSFQMLNEYSRILNDNGIVLIFSLFGPDSDKKDTLGLLNHPNFNVECKNLFTSPAEIPSQEFCYLYILRYVKEN